MKTLSSGLLAFAILSLNLNAQTKTNADIEQQLHALGTDKKIELIFDPGSNMSKLMAVSENFPDVEASRANVRAMNFAIGFFYPGQTLERSPDPILFTFWVLSKKPRFGENHSMTLFVAGETIEIGDSRYVARARDNMEYLNFNLSREVLTKIAKNSNVRFRFGTAEFSFTKGQLRMIANLLLISDPASKR